MTSSDSNFPHVMGKEERHVAAWVFKALLVLVSFQTTVTLAGARWAYRMTSRMTAVETHLDVMAPATVETKVHYYDLIQRLTKCEAEIGHLQPK